MSKFDKAINKILNEATNFDKLFTKKLHDQKEYDRVFNDVSRVLDKNNKTGNIISRTGFDDAYKVEKDSPENGDFIVRWQNGVYPRDRYIEIYTISNVKEDEVYGYTMKLTPTKFNTKLDIKSIAPTPDFGKLKKMNLERLAWNIVIVDKKSSAINKVKKLIDKWKKFKTNDNNEDQRIKDLHKKYKDSSEYQKYMQDLDAKGRIDAEQRWLKGGKKGNKSFWA
jgi:hypothetical protein